MAYFSLYKDRELASAYITTILAVGAYTFWTVLDPEADGAGSAAWR